MVRMEVTIDDSQWPKLKLVVNREGINGQRTTQVQSIQYDQAYAKFENDLHNHLRPMIEELCKRRLGR